MAENNSKLYAQRGYSNFGEGKGEESVIVIRRGRIKRKTKNNPPDSIDFGAYVLTDISEEYYLHYQNGSKEVDIFVHPAHAILKFGKIIPASEIKHRECEYKKVKEIFKKLCRKKSTIHFCRASELESILY